MKRREKNRVAAQKSRKRQTQRADQLHEVSLNHRNLVHHQMNEKIILEFSFLQACEHLEHRNTKLRKEVSLNSFVKTYLNIS